MKPVKIADGVTWVGVLDPGARLLDVIVKVERGTTYNSYLVEGTEKVALIDISKEHFSEEYLTNLRSVVDLKKIDYIIINHHEMDHSGTLHYLLEEAPQATVVISRTAEQYLKNLLHREVNHIKVSDGDKLELGGKTLTFFSTPFIHWPDTMITYLIEDKILFPCDFLGCHFCDERLYNDLVDNFSYAYKHYFDFIFRPFKEHVLKTIAKIEGLEIAMIAPSHGPIHRTDPRHYIETYRQWASVPTPPECKTLLVFYATAYGSTAKMADEIAEGARSKGLAVSVFDLTATDIIPYAVDQIEAADGIAVGSPTINGDAVKPVWDLLSSLATLKIRGKVGAAFGCYGWSGEAPGMIHERLRSLKFRVPLEPVTSKLVATEEELAHCREFGVQLAEELLKEAAGVG